MGVFYIGFYSFYVYILFTLKKKQENRNYKIKRKNEQKRECKRKKR